jgi:hypothetical protein
MRFLGAKEFPHHLDGPIQNRYTGNAKPAAFHLKSLAQERVDQRKENDARVSGNMLYRAAKLPLAANQRIDVLAGGDPIELCTDSLGDCV